jgi:signal transduction histidine kinase
VITIRTYNKKEGKITDNKIQESGKINNDLKVFNSSISHEIKAPIRAIDGYARIFLEDYGHMVEDSGLELIRNIRTICADTLALVNKLLEYTKLDEIEPIKEPVNLKEILDSVFNELAGSNGVNNQVELRYESNLPMVLTDRFLIKQIFTNIVSNSLKFTRGKTGIITAGFRYENDEPVFYIKDNGVGFDMKFSEKLFGMFQRMHSVDDFEGSGLGLALVKKMIESLGGKVWITGEVGKGACTYFTVAKEDILN